MPDNTPQQQDTQHLSRRQRRRRIGWLLGLTIVFAIAAILYAFYWATVARYRVTTDDAYVHGNQVALMAQVAGTVTSVHADDTDRVTQGDVLVTLDPSDADIALKQAKAQLAQTVRQVHALYKQEAGQQAVIAERHSALAQKQRDYKRVKNLLASHAASKRDYQHARTAWKNAQAQLQQAQSTLAALQAETSGTDLRHQPDVRLAIAALRKAYLNRRRTTIVAPVSGYIAKRTVQVGQQVAPGSPLLALVPLAPLWIEANFKETRLGDMRIGQPVSIVSDLYGDNVTYHGHIQGISPGTGSIFELLPPQNATGNWIKIIQRVPVRISLDADALEKHPLRLGLSMHVTVNIHDTEGKALKRKPSHQPLYQTDVFRHQLDGLADLIGHIIEANGGNDDSHTADHTADAS